MEYEIEKDAASHATLDSIVDFTGGTIGGTVSVLVGQPLDTVKVKMQTFPHLYKNAIQCFSNTLRVEGFRHGLYAGTLPAIAANVAENSVLFMFYGTIQRLIMKAVDKNHENELSIFENGMSGFSAAFFSSLTLCPTELVKCRLQAIREQSGNGAKSEPVGVFQLCRQIYRAEGFRGFFHGLVPTFWREMPGYFFFFAAYDMSRTTFMKYLNSPSKDDIGSIPTIISGGIGGCALWGIIFPADVIKSRKQVMSMDVNSSSHKQSMYRMMAEIIKQDGIKGLYRGLGPSLLRTFPATGALFLAYEMTKRSLQGLYRHDE